MNKKTQVNYTDSLGLGKKSSKKQIGLPEQANQPNKLEGGDYKRIEVNKIDPFSGNTRVGENENYKSLKESIKVRGLEQPFKVAINPDSGRFMVSAGGNTRLKALKELYKAGHKKFRYVNCIVEPWVSMSAAIVAHLIESDQHTPYSFLERGLALQNLQKQLRAESEKRLSDADIVARLPLLGYGEMTRQSLALYNYAVRTLYPLFPKALGAGLSGSRVKILRRSINTIKRNAKASGLDQKKVDATIQKLAKNHDTTAHDKSIFIKNFIGAVEKEFKLKSNKSKVEPTPAKNSTTIDKLRDENYKIASELAKQNHIVGIIKKLNEGYGFCVKDLPVHIEDENARERALWCWWLLVSLSGLAFSTTNKNIIADVLGNDIQVEYKEFLFKKKLKNLTALYNYSPASFLEKEISMYIPEESFMFMLSLINNCRSIHRAASGEIWKTYEDYKKDAAPGKSK